MRKLVFVLFAIGAMFTTTAADAAPHTFQGACQLTGVIAWKSYQVREYTFDATGTCSGLFDGEPVQDAPIKVKSKGDVYQFFAPVIGGGAGTLEFRDQKVLFPIAHQQLGAALRVFVACKGCSGGMVGTLENATETQPEPHTQGPRTAVRLFTTTTQPLTR
jgi:hypothetical protein